MLLLAEISTLGAVVLAAVTLWLLSRVVLGRHRAGTACAHGGGATRTHGGGFWKVLGIAAIVAGVGFFWMRVERQHTGDRPASIVADDEVHEFVEQRFAEHRFDGPRPLVQDQFPDRIPDRSVSYEDFHVRPDRWVFVLLGSAVVILGMLLFGRGNTRPGAVKAMTFLGVGAIVYAVVTYVGHPPHTASVPVARFDRVEPEPVRSEAVERRWSRAKRPALRPERPADEARDAETLPPRAGGIPVSDELSKSETANEKVSAEKPQPVPATPETPQPPVEPAPSAAPAETAPTEPAPEKSPSDTTTPSEPPAAHPEASAKPSAPTASSNEPRPDWVDASGGLTAGSVYAMPVHSGRFTSVPECQRAIEHAMKLAADQYIDDYLDPGAAELINVPITYLNQHVKKAEYAEVVNSAVGPMHEIHARLEFDSRVRADFHRLRRNVEVSQRLWYAGGAAALVLALLSTFYGYLKLDLRTGGKNTGSLQLAATLVALIVAGGVLLVRFAVL